MKQFPKSLSQKLQQRIQNNALRKLSISNDLIDFASNDYIGFSNSLDVCCRIIKGNLIEKIKKNI